MTSMQVGPVETSAMPSGVRRPRRAGWVADVALALLVFVIGLPTALHPQQNYRPLYGFLFSVALTLPLIWRRRFPLTVFSVIAAVALLQWAVAVQLTADVALLVAFYTVAARQSRRRTAIAAVVLEVGCVLAAVRWVHGSSQLLVFVFLSGLAGVALLSGSTLRVRRAYLASVEDRAERLEREREQQAQLVAAGERARIAREMHDVVAHNLSVMIALADGASLTARGDAVRAGAAMDQVSSTGRQALTEMRRLLGVLRADDALALQPQPGLADLDQLLAQVRLVGLRGELVTEGQPPASIPPGLQLTVYRLIQEALTNVLKHAVDASAAVVRLRFQPDRLEVEVTDDGKPVSPRHGGDGHGLTGMRERAAVYGGVVEAGPGAGGWRVRTTLPLSSVGTT
jgi:signal transduction histidine kinase